MRKLIVYYTGYQAASKTLFFIKGGPLREDLVKAHKRLKEKGAMDFYHWAIDPAKNPTIKEIYYPEVETITRLEA